jgi:hypothetical protein
MIFTLIVNLIITAILILSAVLFLNLSLAWWLRTKRADYLMESFYKKLVYLEIKLPREVHKSPASMEFVFNAVHQTLGHIEGIGLKKENGSWLEGLTKFRKDWYAKYTKGGMRLWSSLEIVSDEGQIKFYIVMVDKHVSILKSYIYSQYPGIEIQEVEDYTNNFRYKKEGDEQIYVGRYILDKPDFMPIKTYVDYGLDKDPKEEFKIDPLLPLLESMAAIGPGEKFWYQILVKATAEKSWKEQSEQRIDEILGIKRDGGKKIASQTREGSKLTPTEKHELEIIQKNIEKPGFDTIVRMLYIAKKDKYSVARGVMPIVNGMKSFNKEGYNKFTFKTITLDSDYPFLDPKGMWTESTRKFWFYIYVLRTGFYMEAEGGEFGWKDPFKKLFKGKSFTWAKEHVVEEMKGFLFPHPRPLHHALGFVLNTEELATLYHFPGKNLNAPNASKVESIKSEPPINLPI